MQGCEHAPQMEWEQLLIVAERFLLRSGQLVGNHFLAGLRGLQIRLRRIDALYRSVYGVLLKA